MQRELTANLNLDSQNTDTMGAMALAGHEETKVFYNYVCVAGTSLGSARIDVDPGTKLHETRA